MVTIEKIDSTEVNRLIKRLMLLNQKTYPKLLKQSARRVAVNMAINTRPFGKSDSVKLKAQNRVAMDISRVFSTPQRISKTLSPEDKKQFAFLMANKPNAANKFLSDLGISMKYKRSGLKSTHQTARVRGRVPKNHNTQFFTDDEKLEPYIARVQKAVGYAKSIWAQCAKKLGGTRGISAKWIVNKKGGRPDASIVVEKKLKNNVSYTLTNGVPYVSNLTNAKHMRMALKHEEKTLVKMIDHALNKTARRR